MSKKTYIFRDGKFIEVIKRNSSNAPYIHDDTMPPLKNLINGKIYDSKSAYIASIKQEGLDIVGNDLFSEKPNKVKQGLTDEQIMEGIYKAEAIMADPTKRRAAENRNLEKLEKHMQILGIKHIDDLR
jgi:hypothetical protein